MNELKRVLRNPWLTHATIGFTNDPQYSQKFLNDSNPESRCLTERVHQEPRLIYMMLEDPRNHIVLNRSQEDPRAYILHDM